MKISKEEYERSLEIVKNYENNLLSNNLNEFRNSEIIKKYFSANGETYESLIDELVTMTKQISDLTNKDVDINEIINIILEKSYQYHFNNSFNVEKKLKVLIKELLNKYKFKDYSFINNRFLDYYLELFRYLLKDTKILKSIDIKTVIRLRDYIGSNLDFISQSKYLNVYIFLIRRLDNSFLLNMGNKYIDEYKAFQKCYEFA
jgi:hypothetical protein